MEKTNPYFSWFQSHQPIKAILFAAFIGVSAQAQSLNNAQTDLPSESSINQTSESEESEISQTPTTPAKATNSSANTGQVDQAEPSESPLSTTPEANEPTNLQTIPANSAKAEESPTPENNSKPALENTKEAEPDKGMSQVSSAPSTKKEETDTSESEGFSFNSGGVAVGVMTFDGETWSRISWRPEIAIGKLGIVFDIEMFIDGNGNFSSKGWEFDTRDEILNTIYRKIYYVRWAHPGDPFYARVGALEDLSLDAGGLITNGFGNVALYPGMKPLGIHLQFNQLGTVNGSIEGFTNSIEDWQNGGGVLGLRGSLSPLATTGFPILSDLRFGTTWVKDFNQFAAIPDKDSDGCPDRLDDRPSNSDHCVRFVDSERMRDNGVSEEIISQVDSLVGPDEARKSADIRGDFATNRPFAIMGFDAIQPLITTDLLNWKVYSAFAFPLDEDLPIEDSFGSIPLGSALKFFIFDLGLEYRYFQNYFNAGHFDSYYDMERVKFVNDAYQTKSELYWGYDRGVRKGIHGWLGVDLGGIVIVGGSYTHMFTDLKGIPDDRAYTGSAALGDLLISLIPKVSSAEVFYEKDKVGQGLNDEGKKDSFWDKSNFSRYGYRIGVTMAEGMVLRVGSLVTHEYIAGEGLESRTNFTAETVFTF